jgi:uncharacterized protein
MLSAKPWKADAILRLGFSVGVCAYAGSLVLSVQHFASAGGGASPKLFYPLAAVVFGCLVGTLVVISKPWPIETLLQRLIALMVCSNGVVFLGMYVQYIAGEATLENSIWRVVVISLSFQGAAVILIACFLREHQVGWVEAFGFANQWRKAVLAGAFAALFLAVLSWGLQQASAFLMTHLPFFKLQPEEQMPIRALRTSVSLAGSITFGAAAILLVPIAEEGLFRGILYPAIKQTGHPRLALWGSALLFATVHLNLVIFVPLLLLGLVFAVLYEHTNNLLAPITAHALFNTLNFVALYYPQWFGGS